MKSRPLLCVICCNESLSRVCDKCAPTKTYNTEKYLNFSKHKKSGVPLVIKTDYTIWLEKSQYPRYALIVIGKERKLIYTKILKNNEKIICPFCDTIQEDLVQDYLLADVDGKDDCYNCRAIVKIKRIYDDDIEVLFDNYRKRKK